MLRWVLVALLCIVLLSACAASRNPQEDTPRADAEKPAGFWLGLWQGIICPIAFIISWFKSSIGLYEVHNNGFWYNFGFVIGLCIIFGGSGGGGSSAVRKR